MSISSSDVKKAAHLSRLKFSENEIETLKSQLSNIMKMIDQIDGIDCEGVEPLTSVNQMNLRLRQDTEIQNVGIDELFSNSPGKDSILSKEIKCFIVPKVVE